MIYHVVSIYIYIYTYIYIYIHVYHSEKQHESLLTLTSSQFHCLVKFPDTFSTKGETSWNWKVLLRGHGIGSHDVTWQFQIKTVCPASHLAIYRYS